MPLYGGETAENGAKGGVYIVSWGKGGGTFQGEAIQVGDWWNFKSLSLDILLCMVGAGSSH